MRDSLAIVTSKFKLPQNLLLRYEIEVRYMPSISENVSIGRCLKMRNISNASWGLLENS